MRLLSQAGTLLKRPGQAAQKATFVPLVPTDPGYDIILIGGQSNASGRGQPFDVTYLDPLDPRILQFAGSGAYAGQLVQAVEPLAQHDTPTGIGPGLIFARWYAQTIPSYRRVLLVPCAHGGTGFTTSSVTPTPGGKTAAAGGTWEVGGAGVNLAENLITQTQAALAAAGANSRIVAFLWVQGETDAGLTQTQYEAYFDALLTEVRSRVAAAAQTPVVLGQMVPEWISTSTGASPAGGSPGSLGINAAHIDTPYRDLRTAFAYGPAGHQNGTPPLIIHYDGPGQRLLGKAMFDALPLAQANVLGAAPLPPPAVALTQVGFDVFATWTRPACRVTDYTIQYRINGGSWTTLTHTRSLHNVASITRSAGETVEFRVSTVNEQGTSALTASAPLTLVALPGAVTGLATGTITSFIIPLTWTAVATATGYLVEYKKHADSTWTTYGTVTGTSAAVGVLSNSTSYDLRVTATNPAGSGTSASLTSVSTLAAQPLLTDVGVSGYVTVGVRKLVSGYSGPLVRIRRSSDNVEADIGMDATGNLDEAAALAHVGAGSGYVKTAYDQSGNGRNATQTTTASQPRIVNAGVVDKLNGRPTMIFDGVDDYLTFTAGLYAAGVASLLAVAKAIFGTNEALFGEGNAGTSARYLHYAASGGGQTAMFRSDSGTTFSNPGGVTGLANGTLRQISMTDTGSTIVQGLDGSVLSNTYSRAGQTLTITDARIGGQVGATFWWNGGISEIALFGAALSTAQRQAGEANQKAYYATP